MKLIVKKFNNLIKKTIFNVQNKTNNKLTISNFNKYLITFIGLLFFYLFYLLIPLLYDKGWVQNNIENKILNEFKINISASRDISYRILPSPHFLIKDSKILIDNVNSKKSIADIRSLKVFLSQKNFFNKKKMKLKKITIDNANFTLLRNELKIINDYSNNQFSNKKIKIINSNIFFKDNLNEIITIIKINKAIALFDNEKKINLFKLEGNVFGVLFTFNIKGQNNSSKNREINFKAKSLKLDISNVSIAENTKSSIGKNTVSFLNSQIRSKYSIKKELITFESDKSRLNNSKVNYKGKLSINPFDLDLDIDLSEYKISKLFNAHPILIEFIKTGLLFNENLSLDLSIVAKSSELNALFHVVKINSNIVNGKLNLDKTLFINNDIGFLELSNSHVFLENNELTLNTDILINIENSKPLFSFLNTSKKSRKKIENILINLNYNFLTNAIRFNNIKIDNNEMNNQFLNLIEDFNDNNLDNLIKVKNLLNKLLNSYEG
jgi:hypothetical protein